MGKVINFSDFKGIGIVAGVAAVSLFLASPVAALTITEDMTLTEDVSDGIVVEEGVTATLNLGGRKITNNETGKPVILNKGTLTVAGEGSVEATETKSAVIVNYTDATMTVAGGVYSSAKWYIVQNFGEMTIEDGVEMVANGSTVGNASMIKNGWYGSAANDEGVTYHGGIEEPRMTITGGTFTAGLTNCSVVKNDDYGHLVITGGVFSQPEGSLADCDSVILNWNEAEISGGTFRSENGPIISNGAYAGYADMGQITISGGEFVAGENGTMLGMGLGGNGVGLMTIAGGKFSQGVSEVDINTETGVVYYTIEVTGGTFEGDVQADLIGDGKVAALKDGYLTMIVDPEGEMEIGGEEYEVEWSEFLNEYVVEPKLANMGVAEDEEAGVFVIFGDYVHTDRKAHLVATVVDASELTVNEEKGGELIGALDLTVVERDETTVVEIEDNDITVKIYMDAETYGALGEYDKVEVAYFNEEGEEEERLDAELKSESGEYWLEFRTTHLSTYGVLGVNETIGGDTEGETEENTEDEAGVVTPDTGRFTKSEEAAVERRSSVALVMVTVVMMAFGGRMVKRGVNELRRAKNAR